MIAAASKVPILIFSGSFSGEMVKWEQLQLNSFLYRYVVVRDPIQERWALLPVMVPAQYNVIYNVSVGV